MLEFYYFYILGLQINIQVLHKTNSIFPQDLKPTLFEPREPEFWDNPHISKNVLKAHLDQTIMGQAGELQK